MRKLKLNKLNLSLNLKALTTPLLGLSLMAGCVGLFGGSVSGASVTVSTDSIPVSSRQLLFDDGNYSPGVFQTLNTSSNGVVVQQNSAAECTIASF